MDNLDHLDAATIEQVSEKLWNIVGCLRGVVCLLQHQNSDLDYEPDDLFGLGQLFENLSQQLSQQRDLLQYGQGNNEIND